MSVELPKDAKGREIPLDTVALFNRVGNVYSIVRWTFTTDFDLSDGWSNKWRAITDRGFALDPALVYLTTPDTWEKLEEDLGRGSDALNYEACAYFGKSACDCSSCIADISDEERREAVEFLRSGKCLYFAEHRKLELDCNRCMKVSTMLFGHYDALCGLDSCGTDAWQRLADLIDRPSENIERPR